MDKFQRVIISPETKTNDRSTGFSSVTEFIVFIMRTLASNGEIRRENGLTAEELTAVRKRLRELAYLQEEE